MYAYFETKRDLNLDVMYRVFTPMQVKIYLPIETMVLMEKYLLQQSGDSSGLILHLTSDFHKVEMPLQVHGGGSWLFSDIRSSSRLFNNWFSQNNEE